MSEYKSNKGNYSINRGNYSSSNVQFDKLGARISNNFQLRTSNEYRNLSSFLEEFKCIQGQNSNIIDQGQKIAYEIPDTIIPRFFNLLEKCRKKKVVTSFSEKQLEPSGLMLDFDIIQEGEKSQLQDDHFYNITRCTMEVISNMLSYETDAKFTTHVIILRKTKTEFKQQSKSFKDGFHIIIPGIKLNKNVKKFIIKKILEENILESVFDDVSFIGDMNDILDKNSAHVVTLFPGNCKSGKTPYEINRVYKINMKAGKQPTIFPATINEDINMTYEFSVNYSNDGGLIEKKEHSIKEDVSAQITQWSCRPDKVEKKVNEDLSILNMHDPDSDQLKRIIDILSPARCIEYNYWFPIVCALAYTNEKYKSLAMYFSGKREAGVRSEFETTWLSAIQNKGKYSYSKEMIYNYAKIDNPEQYKIIMNESVFAKLTESIFDQKVGGYIDHWHIAQILKEMVGGKFVVDFDTDTNSIKWYEFVLDDDPHSPGEVYKWRCCNDPHTIRNYISIKVPILFDRALEYLENRKNKVTEKGQIDYYNFLIKIVSSSSRKLFNNGFKNGVIKESESIFRRMNFSKSLDKEENIMGVGNGVLVFDKVPKLISCHHHYKISRYSPVNYTKIDIKNPTVLEVYKSIWDLFPDGEKDAFHYIMFFLCTSLTGRIKACLFLTLRGNGANGKSYLMELIRNLLGGVNENGYGCKLPIQYLIEREPMSNNASPVLVPLTWARLTYFSESDKSEQLRVSKKKKLTSHEPINVRPLYGKQKNIIHKSNFILETNYALSIDTTDHGTWRRERYYTMKIKICKNPDPNNKYELQDDPSFSTKKARDPKFLSGVLSILAMYCSVLDMKYGGDINKVKCPTIMRETEEFRNSQDIINRFITERIVITADENNETPFTDLVDNYCRWYDNNVKERRHDRLDISLMFSNSRLGNNIIKKINGSQVLMGMRVLGTEEDKEDDEQFMIENVETVDEPLDNTLSESSDDALATVYREFIELARSNNIEFW